MSKTNINLSPEQQKMFNDSMALVQKQNPEFARLAMQGIKDAQQGLLTGNKKGVFFQKAIELSGLSEEQKEELENLAKKINA